MAKDENEYKNGTDIDGWKLKQNRSTCGRYNRKCLKLTIQFCKETFDPQCLYKIKENISGLWIAL